MYKHIVNGVYIRTDVSLMRHCGMDPEIVYTRDGSVWPRTEHWPGIYLSKHREVGWVICDLVRTALVYAFSGDVHRDRLSGDLRPERVQKWMVFEKDGGVDGGSVVDMWCQGNGWRDRCSGDELAIGGSGWGWVALVEAGLWPWTGNVEKMENIEPSRVHGAL